MMLQGEPRAVFVGLGTQPQFAFPEVRFGERFLRMAGVRNDPIPLALVCAAQKKLKQWPMSLIKPDKQEVAPGLAGQSIDAASHPTRMP